MMMMTGLSRHRTGWQLSCSPGLDGDSHFDIPGAGGDCLDGPKLVQLASMSSDLRCEFEVPDRVQLRAVVLGYKSLALVSVLGDDRPSVRALSSTAAEIASSWGGRSLFDSSG